MLVVLVAISDEMPLPSTDAFFFGSFALRWFFRFLERNCEEGVVAVARYHATSAMYRCLQPSTGQAGCLQLSTQLATVRVRSTSLPVHEAGCRKKAAMLRFGAKRRRHWQA